MCSAKIRTSFFAPFRANVCSSAQFGARSAATNVKPTCRCINFVFFMYL